MGRPAAEPHQARLLQVGEGDEDPRPHAEGAKAATRLALDDAANGIALRADGERVANGHAQLRHQLRAHDHAEPAQQLVAVGDAVREAHRAVIRKALFDGAQFNHASPSVGAVRRLRHGRQLDRANALGLRCAQPAVDRGGEFSGERTIAGDDGVGANQRARFAGEGVADALDHRPQRDNGTDADGDADKEEQQALPGGPHLAHRHEQHEPHRVAP